MRRLAAVLVAVATVGSLVACSDDDSGTSTDPVEVEVGESFAWNGFTIEDGWALEGIQRSVDMEQVTTPEVTGTIVNDSDEERAAIFQLVFSADGDPISTVNCSAATMAEGQSMRFVCPGLNTVMPTDYDAVVVQEFTRDTSTSS